MTERSSRHAWRALASVSHALLWSVAVLLAVGCSGASSGAATGTWSTGPTEEQELRVPECEQYADRAATCFQREELRSQVRVVAHNEAERDRMRETCSQSLQRLSAACR